MPTIFLHWIEGRDDNVKRKVVKGLTDVLVKEAGATPESISIFIQDIKKNNLAKSGQLFCDK